MVFIEMPISIRILFCGVVKNKNTAPNKNIGQVTKMGLNDQPNCSLSLCQELNLNQSVCNFLVRSSA